VVTPRCHAGNLAGLTTLYAQLRPAMLPHGCLTATAGTSLVRGSQPGLVKFRPGGGRLSTPPARKRLFKLSFIDQYSSLLPKAGLLQTPGGWLTAKPSAGSSAGAHS